MDDKCLVCGNTLGTVDGVTISRGLEAHPPFVNKPDNTLVSLATGIVAHKTINCDEAERHGFKAMQEMVGKPFARIKLRRNDKVKPLAAMTNTVKNSQR